MSFRVVFAVVGGIVLSLVGLFLFNRFRLDRENARLVDELLVAAGPQPQQVFKQADLEGLPAPVQRYLSHVLTEGQPYVSTVRWQQRGEMRLNGPDDPWLPFTATQHFTVDPPGFVWDATVKMAPGLPVRVVDQYVDGQGGLRAKILSTITVANAAVSPELNQGELTRYLAEAMWFPTAYLPGQGVVWTPIDDTSAKATLEHNGASVSLTFHFNANDEIDRIVAEDRYRGVDEGFEPTPWAARGHNFQMMNGMLIPAGGEVAWHLPEGDFTYWRGRTESIEHR